LLHGEAIAIGMVAESQLAEHVGVATAGTAARVQGALVRAGLPVAIPDGMSIQDIVASTHGDKKRRGARIEYALPTTIGAMAGAESAWAIAVDDRMVAQTLDGMIRGC
jgi:3-dehydroquinate synthetase